ncbi:hypothetical protein [Wukongibacter baidiensis]
MDNTDIKIFDEEKEYYGSTGLSKTILRKVRNNSIVVYILLICIQILGKYSLYKTMPLLEGYLDVFTFVTFEVALFSSLLYIGTPKLEHVENQFIRFDKTYMEIHISSKQPVFLFSDKRHINPETFKTVDKRYGNIHYKTYIIPFKEIKIIRYGTRYNSYYIYFNQKDKFDESLSIPASSFSSKIWDDFEKINSKLNKYQAYEEAIS